MATDFDQAFRQAQQQPSDGDTRSDNPFVSAFSEAQPTAVRRPQVTAQPTPPPSSDGDFMRGLKRTLPELKQLAGGTMAAVGDVTGWDGLRDKGLEIYQNQENVIRPLARPTDSASEAWNQVKQGNFGAGVDFLQNAAGYTTGQALESLTAMGAGAALGAAVTPELAGAGSIPGAIGGFVGRQALKRGVKRQAEKIIAEQVAHGVARREAKQAGAEFVAQNATRGALDSQLRSRFTQAQINRMGGSAIGGAAGAQGMNTVMELGSVYPEAYQGAQEEGRQMTPGEKARAVGGALAAAGVESAADLFNVGRLGHALREAGTGAGERTLRQAAKDYGKRALVEVPEGMLREAGTEAVQTGLERFGARQSLTDAEAMRDYIDSAAVGAVGGGLFGGAAAIRKPSRPQVMVDPQTGEAKPVPSAGNGPISGAVNAGVENGAIPSVPKPTPTITAQEVTARAQAKLDALNRAADGTPDTQTVDDAGNAVTVPGERPRILADNEKALRTFLTENIGNPDALASFIGMTIQPEAGSLADAANAIPRPRTPDMFTRMLAEREADAAKRAQVGAVPDVVEPETPPRTSRWMNDAGVPRAPTHEEATDYLREKLLENGFAQTRTVRKKDIRALVDADGETMVARTFNPALDEAARSLARELNAASDAQATAPRQPTTEPQNGGRSIEPGSTTSEGLPTDGQANPLESGRTASANPVVADAAAQPAVVPVVGDQAQVSTATDANPAVSPETRASAASQAASLQPLPQEAATAPTDSAEIGSKSVANQAAPRAETAAPSTTTTQEPTPKTGVGVTPTATGATAQPQSAVASTTTLRAGVRRYSPTAQTAQAYYQPGRVVPSYYGQDRVLAFRPEADGKPWAVQVQAVDKAGNPTGEPRWHATFPEKKELNAVLGAASQYSPKALKDRAASLAQGASTPANESQPIAQTVESEDGQAATEPTAIRIEPLGAKGLLVHGDHADVRAKLQAAGFKKKGRVQDGALRFDAADRPAIEAALRPADVATDAGNVSTSEPSRSESDETSAGEAGPVSHGFKPIPGETAQWAQTVEVGNARILYNLRHAGDGYRLTGSVSWPGHGITGAPAVTLVEGRATLNDAIAAMTEHRLRVEARAGDRSTQVQPPSSTMDQSDKIVADTSKRVERLERRAGATQTADRFANNKMFTSDKVAAAKARLKAKLGQLNSGVDPELFVDGVTIAGAYIESGVRKFADYAKAMVEDLGDAIKPYLLSFYEGVRHFPGVERKGMDSADDAARQFDALLTPADVQTDAIGQAKPPRKTRAKATTDRGARTLRDDWGVDHINGYSNTSSREEGNDTKDAFLKDASAYLKAVAEALEDQGYTVTLDRKGKPAKAVSVNESGMAGSGDVYLHMVAPDGTGIYVHVGGTALRGVVPSTTSGIALMYRTSDGTHGKSGANQWGRVDLTAAELAAELAAHVARHPWKPEANKGGLPVRVLVTPIGRDGLSEPERAAGKPPLSTLPEAQMKRLEQVRDALPQDASDELAAARKDIDLAVKRSVDGEAGTAIIETLDRAYPRIERQFPALAEVIGEVQDEIAAADKRSASTQEPAYNAAEEASDVRRDEDFQRDREGAVRGGERQRPAEDRNDDAAADLGVRQPGEAAETRRERGADATADEQVPGRAGAGERDARAERASDGDRVPAGGRAAPDAVVPKSNFTITGELDFAGVGAVGKFNGNLAAIRLLKELEADGRRATPEEQSVLARYVGWGGLPQAFRHPTSGKITKGWDARVAELEQALTPEELAAAGRSTQDAHYTSERVVRAMWRAVDRLGFTQGRVLEPSMGTGNFFGLMPQQARAASALTGVELDSITGRIARQLYQGANVQVRGFNDIKIAPESFDLAIGNPPFGSQSIHDPQYPDLSKWSIHNFFFAKSIASLRPGGVLAMVVSSSFLDANTSTTRAWVAERARLLGAIRLPQTAFQQNAGTNVTTDIVFLQRLADGMEGNAQEWVAAGTASDQGQEFPLNRYFLANPDMMLGRMVWSTHTTVGRAGAVLEANPGEDLAAALDAAVAKLPAGVYVPPAKPAKKVAAEVKKAAEAAAAVKVYGYFVAEDGSLRQRHPDATGEHTDVVINAGAAVDKRIRAMIPVRDATRDLLAAELSDASDAGIEAKRKELNRVYDAFVKANGRISRDVNKRALRDDPDFPLLLSLERDYDKGVTRDAAKKAGVEPRAESARKADIFTKRTNYPVKPVTSVSDAKSAMLASLNERGRIDLDYMAELYAGKDRDAIVAELGDLVFRTPEGGIEPADGYLSGNVKAKLAAAREAAKDDPGMRRNVAALEKVQPQDVDAADIFVQIGTPWIPASDYADFVRETIEGKFDGRHVLALGKWLVDVQSGNHTLNKERWGTERMGADAILEAILTDKPIVVKDKGANRDDPPVVNKAETAAALGKASELQTQFVEWLWKDASRRERLARFYNDTFNTDVRRKYDGAHMTFPGMSRGVLTGGKLRPHQSAFAYRMVQDGVAMADHVVGAGKTYAAIAGTMEMRRLGLWRKPMIVVPNHLVDQWASDFLKLYPGANVLAAGRKDFEKSNRRKLFGRIATGDWDAVIVAHSSFGFIPVPAEAEARILRTEIKEIEDALDAIRAESGKKDLSFKQLQKRKETLDTKIKKLNERARDDLLDFAEMGVDSVVLDEAHEFKNLFFVTSKRNVAGLGSPEGSKKAFDLYVKTRMLAERDGGKNRVFLTGTPVSNTLSEVYHMQRYLQREALEERGVASFDAWASVFGQIVSDWEMDAAGRFKEKTRFRKFANLPELVSIWRQVADTVTRADLIRDADAQGLRFPLPKIKGNKPQNIVVPRSPLQAAYIGVPTPVLDAEGKQMHDQETGEPLATYPEGSIIYRMDNMPKDPSEDNYLKATGDARKAGLDFRLVDPAAPDFPQSKANEAVRRIVELWKENNARRGTQLVFCDLSVPASARGKATETAQAKQPTWFIRRYGVLEHVAGVKAKLSAMPDHPFFTMKEKGGYRVYDAIGAVRIGDGRTKQEALDSANAALASNPDGMRAQFEESAIPPEEIDAYVQAWEDAKAAKDEADDNEEEDTGPAVSMDELLADQSKFSVYDDMKEKLLAAGVPPEQIAFIHDYNTDLQKADLFAKVNRGDIRVLFGSTMKMGAGMNVQKKLVALHHMDAPWRPSDLEQREGRIIRQGNEFYEADPDGFEIVINRYGTAETYDAKQWEIIQTKAEGIETFKAGDPTVREIDDISSEAANAADMKGAASGNPLILESIKLRKEIKDLEAQERSFTRARNRMESMVRSVEAGTSTGNRMLAEAQAVKDAIKLEDGLALTIDGNSYTERKAVKLEPIAGLFQEALQKRDAIEAGMFHNMRIIVDGRQSGKVEVHLMVGKIHVGNTSFAESDNLSASGFVSRLENIVARVDSHLEYARNAIAQEKREAEQAREELRRGFPKEAELAAKRERSAKVVAALRSGKRAVDEMPAAGRGSEGMFSRADNSQRGSGLSMDDGQRLKRELTAHWGKNAPRVVLVESAEELRDIARQQGVDPTEIDERVEGLYLGKPTVWLNLSAIHTPERFAKVLAHEATGHYGVEQVVGEQEWAAITDAVNRHVDNKTGAKDVQAAIAQLRRTQAGIFKIKDAALRRQTIAKEVIAVMTENGSRNGLVMRVIAAVRRFLRKLMPGMAWRDADIRDLILQAHGFMRDGRTTAQRQVQAHAFSVGVRSAFTDAANFAKAVRDFVANPNPQPNPKAVTDIQVTQGTPDVYAKLGVADKPFVIRRDKLKTILEEHPEITVPVLQQLVRHLHEPVAVFQSGANSTNPNGLVALTELEIDGKPVMIAMNLGVARKDGVVVNQVSSYYGRDGREKFLRNIGALRYIDQSKAPAWLSNDPKIKDSRAAAKASGRKILTDADVVKPFTSGTGNYSQAAPNFYSAMLEAVDAGKGAPKKADAAAWKGWMDGAVRRGEFKQAERDWLGVDAWLDGRDSTTRQEIADFIRANQVQVQDVVLGSAGDVYPEGSYQSQITGEVQSMDDWMIDVPEMTREELEDDLTDVSGDPIPATNETKFASYQLPGGENYRELLLTLPQKETYAEYSARMLAKYGAPWYQQATDAEKTELERLRVEHNAAFRSHHFDQPNILAHVRFNERTDADGKRVLFIEEIQSDWHQQGRKRGYGRKWVVRYGNEQIDSPAGVFPTEDEARAKTAELNSAIPDDNYGYDYKEEIGTPDAPFKATDAWAMLAFKRMVRYAAEHGFDRIAWTTGTQQAERYDLSKQVDRIDYTKTPSGDIIPEIFQTGGGKVPLPKRVYSPDELADVVGKEIAERIANDGNDGSSAKMRSLSGDGLKIGGSGMRDFYDRILPKAVNKWAKKFGGKVGQARLGGGAASYESLVDAAQRTGRTQAELDAMPVAERKALVDAQLPHVHSLDLTPQMRDAALQGLPLFSRAPAEELASIEADMRAVAAAADGGDGVVARIKQWLKDATPKELKDRLRGTWLGALTTRMLTTLGQDYFPTMRLYTDFLAEMQASRNEMQQEGEDVAETVRKWAGKNRQDAERLFDTMHEATIAGVDPAEAYQPLTFKAGKQWIEVNKQNVKDRIAVLRDQMLGRGGDSKQDMMNEVKALRAMLKAEPHRKAKYPALVAKWNQLSPEAQQHYRTMRDLYSKRHDATEAALIQRINDLKMDGGENRKRVLIDVIRQQFEAQRLQGVYFPLQRFGQYFVAAEKNGVSAFQMYGSLPELKRAVAALRARDYTITAQGLKSAGKAKDAPSGTFVAEVIEAMHKAHVSEQVQDEIYQMYLQALPELSMRKHKIHRKAIPGWDTDALRAFSFNMLHGAHQIARLQYAHKLSDTIDVLQAQQDAARKAPDADTARITAGDHILEELRRRHDWINNPQDSKLTNLITSAGFTYYLGVTPAAALVNLTQVPMITLPYLGSRFGHAAASKALFAAMKASARTGGHIQRTLTSQEEIDAHKALQRAGALDKTQVHNLAGIAEGGMAGFNPKWAKAMAIIGLPFHKAEVINREATGMAAFRLARAEGRSFAEAVKFAADAIHETQFDYSNANRARFLQSGPAKVLLMFRQYSQNLTWHIGRMVWEATKHADPDVRRIARRNLAGVLGMSALFSGTLGLPLMSMTMGILNAIAASFGDDDEPWDAETEFRAFLNDMLGKTGANVVLHGAANAITGADIASRVSYSDLWFRDADRELDGRGQYYNLLEQAAGPMGGVLKNVLVGKQLADEGHLMRGIETMMPKAIKDGFKALRYATEGVNNLRGNPVLEDPGVAHILAQGIGFTPAEVSERYAENRALKNYEQYVIDRRRALMDGLAMAVRLGDSAARAEVMGKIRTFNRTWPQIALTPDSIRRSLKSRARYDRQAENGIFLNRKIAGRVREAVGVE